MSISLLRAELERFLISKKPEVLCISGKWGVGKTYAWTYYLGKVQESGGIGLQRYSYVSLFGKSSLDDIRTALVEGTIDSKVKGKKPDLRSFESVCSQLLAQTGRITFFANLIGSNKYSQFINRALFLAFSNSIVCFDDLERAGSGVAMRDVLGLVSDLSTNKSCKVIILLNIDALTESNRREFSSQLEKVADVTIAFEPTPAESVEIGLTKNTPFYVQLSRYILQLGVRNIRVIRKMEHFCDLATSVLVPFDRRLCEQALHTICLATYAKFQPEEAPGLDLIKGFNSLADMVEKQHHPGEDVNRHHKDFLRAYGLNSLDELDLELIKGVERGFFDDHLICVLATEAQTKLQITDKNNAFQKAWETFHGSFDDNEPEVMTALSNAIRANAEVIPPSDLSVTMALMKEFGYNEDAQSALNYYMENRHGSISFWDLTSYSHGGPVTDVDVKAAFANRYTALASKRNPKAVLERIELHGGWNSQDIDDLGMLTVEDFKSMFKNRRGSALSNLVNTALMFRSIGNANHTMRGITSNAEEALRQIGAESRLNARRVAKYNIPGSTQSTT